MGTISKGVAVKGDDRLGQDLRFKIMVDRCPDKRAREDLVLSIERLSGIKDFVFPPNGEASLVLRSEVQRTYKVKERCTQVIAILSRGNCFTEPPALPNPLF